MSETMRYDACRRRRIAVNKNVERVKSMGRLIPASLVTGLLLMAVLPMDSWAGSKRALLIGINEYPKLADKYQPDLLIIFEQRLKKQCQMITPKLPVKIMSIDGKLFL